LDNKLLDGWLLGMKLLDSDSGLFDQLLFSQRLGLFDRLCGRLFDSRRFFLRFFLVLRCFELGTFPRPAPAIGAWPYYGEICVSQSYYERP
jgi:hypothetical protein